MGQERGPSPAPAGWPAGLTPLPANQCHAPNGCPPPPLQLSGEDGRVLGFYADPTGEVVASITHAEEHGDRLWLGNLRFDYVSYIELSKLT